MAVAAAVAVATVASAAATDRLGFHPQKNRPRPVFLCAPQCQWAASMMAFSVALGRITAVTFCLSRM